MCHTVLQTACEQDQDGTAVPSLFRSQVCHIPLLCVQWRTPDDGQRNCPKQVQFRSKIKTFEKLVHLVGSIIRSMGSERMSNTTRFIKDVYYNQNNHMFRLLLFAIIRFLLCLPRSRLLGRHNSNRFLLCLPRSLLLGRHNSNPMLC
jgi:hypothetical protein